MVSKSSVFTNEDKKLMEEKGISMKLVEQQLAYFSEGFPFAEITEPATVKHGIKKLSESEKAHYISIFEHHAKDERILKFVPASGAASRMFKVLTAYMNSDETGFPEKYESVKEFFDNLHKFAFYDTLKNLCEKTNTDIEKDKKKVLRLLLTPEGMDYGNLPKALLLFHKYDNGNRTAAEEHFVEAINYAASKGKAFLHFTVSPEHLDLFKTHIEKLKSKYSESHNINFNVSLSVQKPHTDTIAADMSNQPFRTDEGKLLFRPGGHGALIENLNELSADIIYIKNIDNIVPDRLKDDTFDYKKALAGLLIEARDKLYFYLRALDAGDALQTTIEAENFIGSRFSYSFPDNYESLSLKEKKEFLHKLLNRPIRVCGMVRNEGEPGGGPFFVGKENGEKSLQVVEMSQIDMSHPEKCEIVDAATHFNPVDLVLSTTDYNGNPFDLKEFTDPKTGFISEKSQNGSSLKALELPGLWNGAMAKWNTIFVEVPISTFNPVKTINDLLREQHLQ